MPSTLVAKASYTPIGDTGIPPKQILEQVIEGISIKWQDDDILQLSCRIQKISMPAHARL